MGWTRQHPPAAGLGDHWTSAVPGVDRGHLLGRRPRDLGSRPGDVQLAISDHSCCGYRRPAAGGRRAVGEGDGDHVEDRFDSHQFLCHDDRPSWPVELFAPFQ